MVLDPTAIDRLLVAFGDDGRAVVAELVATFLAEAPTRLDALRRGVGAGDGVEVHRASHSLKSAAATLGALGLAEACREVEVLARAGDLAAVAAVVPSVEAEYERVRQALVEVVR